jgi:hypothetical protein
MTGYAEVANQIICEHSQRAAASFQEGLNKFSSRIEAIVGIAGSLPYLSVYLKADIAKCGERAVIDKLDKALGYLAICDGQQEFLENEGSELVRILGWAIVSENIMHITEEGKKVLQKYLRAQS